MEQTRRSQAYKQTAARRKASLKVQQKVSWLARLKVETGQRRCNLRFCPFMNLLALVLIILVLTANAAEQH
jgi:hypothetical protein